MNIWTPPAPRNPLLEAIERLQANGRIVSYSDIPGLFYVDGHELTINQVMAVAADDGLSARGS